MLDVCLPGFLFTGCAGSCPGFSGPLLQGAEPAMQGNTTVGHLLNKDRLYTHTWVETILYSRRAGMFCSLARLQGGGSLQAYFVLRFHLNSQ